MELTRLPKPTMVWNPSRFCTNERIGNLSCAITKLKSHVLSLVKTTVGLLLAVKSDFRKSNKSRIPKSFLSDFHNVDSPILLWSFSDASDLCRTSGSKVISV